jgi:hypothetical protein
MVSECPTCIGYSDLGAFWRIFSARHYNAIFFFTDMSPALFEQFAPLSVGTISNINWHFNPK